MEKYCAGCERNVSSFERTSERLVFYEAFKWVSRLKANHRVAVRSQV